MSISFFYQLILFDIIVVFITQTKTIFSTKTANNAFFQNNKIKFVIHKFKHNCGTWRETAVQCYTTVLTRIYIGNDATWHGWVTHIRCNEQWTSSIVLTTRVRQISGKQTRPKKIERWWYMNDLEREGINFTKFLQKG